VDVCRKQELNTKRKAILPGLKALQSPSLLLDCFMDPGTPAAKALWKTHSRQNAAETQDVSDGAE